MTDDSTFSSPSDGQTTRLEKLLDVVCPYSPVLTVFFSIALLFALFSVFIIVAVSPAKAEFVVSLMTIALNLFVMGVTGPLLYLCRKHRLG